MLLALLASFWGASGRPASAQSGTETADRLAVAVRAVFGGTTFGTTSSIRATGLATKSSETDCLWIDASGDVARGACPTGDITDVSFTLPGLFNAVSPCTTGNCAFTFALANTTANWIFARSTGTGPPSMQAMTKAMMPATTVHTGQTNSFGAFLQTFGAGITVSAGTSTFGGAIAANGGSITSTAATLGIDAGGTINFVDKVTFGGNVGGNMIPTVTDTYNLGSYSFYWNEGFISQLNAVLFAEATATLFGGYNLITPNAGAFGAAVTAVTGADTINFGKTLVSPQNMFVEVRAKDTAGVDRVEYMQITNVANCSSCTVNRGLSNGNVGYAFAQGTPYAINGASGAGRIAAVAYTSPYIAVYKQGATYGAKTTMAKFGELNGDYGFATSAFGFGAGDYAEESVTIEPTDGFKIMNNGTKRVQFDGTNGLRLFKSDGSTVALQLNMSGSAAFTGDVTAAGGAIGNWSIGANTISATNISLTSGAANTANITAGTGATAGGINSASAGGDVVFWSGSTFANRATAPFRVTADGAMTATSATVTGSIQTTANCGSASAWCGIFDSNGLKWYDSSNKLRVFLNSSWKGVAVVSSDFGDIYDKEGNFEFVGPSGSVGIFGTTAFENAAHTVKHVKLTTRNAYATGASTKAAYLHITAEGTNTSNATDSETTGGARIELYSAGPSATQTITATAATAIAAVTPIMEVVQDAASANLQATTYIGGGSGLIGVLKSRTAHGTSSSPTQMLSGERYGLVAFEGYATTSGFVASSVINAYATENHTSTARGSYLSFGTTHAGTTTRADRVKVSSTGGGSPTLDALAGAWGTGASAYGAFVGAGNNSSGNGAAGVLSMYRRSGTIDFVWADNAGNLRINSAPPTESLGSPNYDTTTGTVVGTQTSSRRFKNVLRERTDYDAMRDVVLFAPVWDFTYKNGAFGGEMFTGIVCEDTPEFCMDGGKSLNPANAIGYLIGTVKAQQAQIDSLEARIAALERLITPR